MGLEALATNFVGRNISSTCNSSGTALWASAKNIKPLVDANCHTEAKPALLSPKISGICLANQTTLFASRVLRLVGFINVY